MTVGTRPQPAGTLVTLGNVVGQCAGPWWQQLLPDCGPGEWTLGRPLRAGSRVRLESTDPSASRY
jgi:hypothetical protein